MDLITLLFNFKGRISRSEYWLAILFYFLVSAVFLISAAFWFGGLNRDLLFNSPGTGMLFGIVAGAITVAGTWSGLAIGIKQLHDRGKSGWWILVFWFGPILLNRIGSLIPNGMAFLFYLAGFAVSIWFLIELGFLRGTQGTNEYGVEPFSEADTVVRI